MASRPGASYAVAVSASPSGQACSLVNGVGTVDADGDAVNSLNVNCVANDSVGGMVSGLANGATLLLTDGTSTLPITTNGPYVFADNFAPGAPYNVTVAAQPAGQSCALSGGQGSMDGNGDAVTNVNRTCFVSGTISGSVTGLAAGATITLNDGISNLQVSANGPFAFGDLFPAGTVHGITIATPPASGLTCVVANFSGMFNASDGAVTNVAVSCN
jgi:hypothetical protein